MYDISLTSLTRSLYPELLSSRAPLAVLQYSPLPHQVYNPQKKQRTLWRTEDLTPLERDMIGPMKEHLQQHFSQEDFSLIPHWSDINVLQYVQQTNNRPKEAVALLKTTFQWLRQPYFRFEGLSSAQQEIIKRGAIYSYGRDSRHRPVVVMDIPLMVQYLRAGRGEDLMVGCFFMFQSVKLVMMWPGKVEQVVCLLSFSGLSMTSIPVRFIADLIAVLNKHFIHLADTIFIHDAPRFILFSWALIKKCFNKETNERIQFTSPSNGLLPKAILGPNLESRFGGSVSLDRFYPPQRITPESDLVPLDKGQEEEDSAATVYYSFEEDKQAPQQSPPEKVPATKGKVETGEPECVQQAQCGLFSCGVQPEGKESEACNIL